MDVASILVMSHTHYVQFIRGVQEALQKILLYFKPSVYTVRLDRIFITVFFAVVTQKSISSLIIPMRELMDFSHFRDTCRLFNGLTILLGSQPVHDNSFVFIRTCRSYREYHLVSRYRLCHQLLRERN